MVLITIPDKSTGGSLTAAEFNQILDAIKDGTYEINTAGVRIGGNVLTFSTGLTDTSSTITVDASAIDHDSLLNYSASEHFTQAAISITASQVSDFDTEVSNNVSVAANTTHSSSNGSDHSFIDQDVTSGASPTFDGANFSGIPNSAVTTGISNTNLLVVDAVGVADNDYAKFTLNGLEGRSYSEVKTDLSLNNVENTALSTWAGSANITTVGTIGTGTWQGTAIGDTYISSATTWNAALQDVVDDTSPALGGDLVAGDFNITGLGSVGFTQELDNGSKSASFSIDFGTDQKQKVTLTANTMTLTLDTTFGRVGNYVLKIVNGGLATLTWASESGSIFWPGGTAPDLTASGTDIVSFYFDGTNWYGVGSLDFS